MMKKKNKILLLDKRGFTVAEFLVVALIFSVLAGGIYTTLAVGNLSWQTNKVQIELQQELRKAKEWMKDEIREAGSSSIINIAVGGNDTDLSFYVPTGISAGNITWDTNDILFDLGGTDSDELHRTYNSSEKILAHNLKTLTFSRPSSNIINVAMTAEKNTVSGDVISYTLDFDVQLRNQ